MLKFKPKSEDELREENLFPKGEYDYEVIDAEDCKSKAGNDQIKVKLNCFGPAGRSQHVYDYLQGGAILYKLRHFCASNGLIEKYEAGTLSAQDCIGRCGKVKLKVEPAGDFPAKNSVTDYIVPKDEAKAKEEEEDDVPFN